MSQHTSRRRRMLATSSVVVGAGLAAAGVASAASTGPTTTTTVTDAATTCQGLKGPPGPGHGFGDTPLTGSDLTNATAVATAAVPGATVLGAERDRAGAYEMHMKKVDGTVVTVKLDAGFKVTGVKDAFAGAPPGAPMGPPGSMS